MTSARRPRQRQMQQSNIPVVTLRSEIADATMVRNTEGQTDMDGPVDSSLLMVTCRNRLKSSIT
jgi:hypothetical protein